MKVEDWLDRFFRCLGYKIESTTPYLERTLCLGDRIFTRRDGQQFYIEYKSGLQTFFTGNIFLETLSVDSQDKPGWVYTCRADFLLYAALYNDKILIMRPVDLRARIEALKSGFQIKKTGKGQNRGYDTHGVLVPLDYAERCLTASIIRGPSPCWGPALRPKTTNSES